jgi:hypothetical protein
MTESGRLLRPDGMWQLAFFCERCNAFGGFRVRWPIESTLAPGDALVTIHKTPPPAIGAFIDAGAE